MLIPWLRAGHFVGLALWVGGLVVLARLCLRQRQAGEATPSPLADRVARWAAGPGAFITLFTGIGLFHSQQALLKQPYMFAKLALVAGLLVADHGLMRARREPTGPRRLRLAEGVVWVVSLGAVLLVEMKPWAR